METLERHHIAIDAYRPLFPDETTFLLTHLHADHANIPAGFTGVVYASVATGALASIPQVRAILEPGGWYRTHRHHLPFRVVDTAHTPESIGFFFPTLAVLYVGDGTVPSFPLYRSLTVVYDGLHEAFERPVPTMRESCALILRALRTTCPILQATHHGILGFLKSSCGISFRLHASLPPLVRRTARYLDMVDDQSEFTLVGRSYAATERVVPSSFSFLEDDGIDAFAAYADGDKIRVFCSLHASSRDIQAWRRDYPFILFEPMKSRAI